MHSLCWETFGVSFRLVCRIIYDHFIYVLIRRFPETKKKQFQNSNKQRCERMNERPKLGRTLTSISFSFTLPKSERKRMRKIWRETPCAPLLWEHNYVAHISERMCARAQHSVSVRLRIRLGRISVTPSVESANKRQKTKNVQTTHRHGHGTGRRRERESRDKMESNPSTMEQLPT